MDSCFGSEVGVVIEDRIETESGVLRSFAAVCDDDIPTGG